MASAFAHVTIPLAVCIVTSNLTRSYKPSERETKQGINWRLFALGAIVSVLPDADVLAFALGIPYESPFGHRGFTHSIAFALVIGVLCLPLKSVIRASALAVFSISFISCISHALLDALTNGGLGVAIMWPFDDQRWFLPFRPIQVSPIGVQAFFSERGLRVIMSEIVWVFLPVLLLISFSWLYKRVVRWFWCRK